MQENQQLTFHKNYTPLVRRVLAEHQHKEGKLLPILHGIQDELGFIPPTLIDPLSKALNLSTAEIHGVISFYAHYRTTPTTKVHIEICQAEACQAMGAIQLKKELVAYLEQSGHDVTIDNVYCLGLCAQSPAAMINRQPVAKLNLDKAKGMIARSLA